MKIYTHCAFSFYPKQRHLWDFSLRGLRTFTTHGVTMGKHEGQSRKDAPVATYLDKQSYIWSSPRHTA